MKKLLGAFLLTNLFLCVFLGSQIWAGTYTSKTYKYSLNVPEQWEELSERTIGNLLDQSESFIPREQLLNMRMAVLSGKTSVFQEIRDGQIGVANIVVSAESGSPPMNEDFREHVRNSIISGLQQSGFKSIKLIDSKLIKVVGKPSILTTCSYAIDYGYEIVRFRVMQYVMPNKQYHFLMACTAPEENFVNYLPFFESARDSFSLNE